MNNDIWADGLLVFYEIFKYLEENVSQQILPVDLFRTESFEKDIEFYKGSDWRVSYVTRPAVKKYLLHLHHVNQRNPLLLIAFTFHLYMGLLSGGQILTKKRKLKNKLFNARKEDESVVELGNQVTSFGNYSTLELKNRFRTTIDEFSKDFDEELIGEIIEESKRVFELNNELIQSIEGVGDQLMKNFKNFFVFCVLPLMIAIYLFCKL
jgi:heme oxygenase 2